MTSYAAVATATSATQRRIRQRVVVAF